MTVGQVFLVTQFAEAAMPIKHQNYLVSMGTLDSDFVQFALKRVKFGRLFQVDPALATKLFHPLDYLSQSVARAIKIIVVKEHLRLLCRRNDRNYHPIGQAKQAAAHWVQRFYGLKQVRRSGNGPNSESSESPRSTSLIAASGQDFAKPSSSTNRQGPICHTPFQPCVSSASLRQAWQRLWKADANQNSPSSAYSKTFGLDSLGPKAGRYYLKFLEYNH